MKDLDSEWEQSCSFDDEKQAKQEFCWLVEHNHIKDYLLVTRFVPYKESELWDDDIPF